MSRIDARSTPGTARVRSLTKLSKAPRRGSTPKKAQIRSHTEVVRRQVALRLADQYRFAESRMGDALPDAWRADIARIM